MKRWQDIINVLLGLWLMASPWALGMSDHTTALIGLLCLGFIVAAMACGAILVPQAWAEWSECFLGAVTCLSPWLLGFQSVELAMTSTVVSGAVIILLAGWRLAADRQFESAWRQA